MYTFPNGELLGNLVVAPTEIVDTPLALQYQQQMLMYEHNSIEKIEYH